MMMTDSDTRARGRLERFVPLVAGLAIAAPSLLARYLPMSDLALHEGVVGILRHFGDASYFPPDLYQRNLGHPNQLFYVAAWLLSYAVGTAWAVKIVVAAAQVLIFVAGARFADYLGRSRWSVLLLTPLALGFTYYWGLVTNLLGFAAFLFALPTVDRANEAPSLRGVGRVLAVLALLFFAHGSVYVAVGGIIVLFALTKELSWRGTALRVAPTAIAAAIWVVHDLWARTLFTNGLPIPPATYFDTWSRIYSFPNVLFGSHDYSAQLLLLALALLATAALLVGLVREREPRPRREDLSRFGRLRLLLHRFRFEVTAFIFLVAYFVMPFNYDGATLLHERFLGPAWAIFVVCAAPRRDTTRLAKITTSVVPLGVLLVSWPQFVDANRAFKDLDVVLAHIPRGSSVTTCYMDPKGIYRTRIYSAGVGPARSVAVVGGRNSLTLGISPISPILMNPKYLWDENGLRVFVFGSVALQPRHDLKHFGWVIASSREPGMRELLKLALAPEAEYVLTSGQWMLFKSTFPPVPANSPPLPADPTAETVIQRLQRIVKTRTAPPPAGSARAP